MPTPLPIDDELALRRLQDAFHAGDPDAFRVLVEPHLDAMYTLALRVTSNPAEAEEVAQEALATALAKCRLYQPGRKVRPWLLTIAANLARSRMRSPWWRRALPLHGREHTDNPGPHLITEAEDRDRKVRESLAALPLKYREAVALFHLEDMSYKEMSEITGVSVAALKQRVRRGCIMLEGVMREMYPDLAS